MPKAIKYTAVLIAIYLGVNYASGSRTVLGSGASGARTIITTLQGR